MADQSVKITNLPDSGSPQRVAYDLANRIWHAEHQPGSGTVQGFRSQFLDLFAECLDASVGARRYNRPS